MSQNDFIHTIAPWGNVNRPVAFVLSRKKYPGTWADGLDRSSQRMDCGARRGLYPLKNPRGFLREYHRTIDSDSATISRMKRLIIHFYCIIYGYLCCFEVHKQTEPGSLRM